MPASGCETHALPIHFKFSSYPSTSTCRCMLPLLRLVLSLLPCFPAPKSLPRLVAFADPSSLHPFPSQPAQLCHTLHIIAGGRTRSAPACAGGHVTTSAVARLVGAPPLHASARRRPLCHPHPQTPSVTSPAPMRIPPLPLGPRLSATASARLPSPRSTPTSRPRTASMQLSQPRISLLPLAGRRCISLLRLSPWTSSLSIPWGGPPPHALIRERASVTIRPSAAAGSSAAALIAVVAA